MESTFARFVRFGFVGVANAVVFAAATSLYVSGFGLGSKAASFLGYCTTVPFAFLAQRSFAFRARGVPTIQFVRFGITHVLGMLVSVLAMGVAVDRLGLHFSVGIAVAIIVVPIATFITLDNWVFAARPRGDVDSDDH